MDASELLKDHQLYHTDLQMDSFITTSHGGTDYGMYCHALRELYKRTRGLREMYIGKERLLLDIEEKEAEDVSGIAERRNRLDILEFNSQMEETDRNIKHTEREYQHFYSQAHVLKEKVGELTPERRKKLDSEMWVYKLKSDMALELICGGGIKQDTIALIHSLPLDSRSEVIESMRDKDRLVDWFNNQDAGGEFEVIKLDFTKIHKKLTLIK